MAKKKKPPKLPGGGVKYVNVRNVVSQKEIAFRQHFARQFVIDAAVLAAHETFGAGEKRINDFYCCLHEKLMEMAKVTLEDSKDDKELVYMKDKLDEALKPLMGANFRPYDERYGG